jgi:hypothetical protein
MKNNNNNNNNKATRTMSKSRRKGLEEVFPGIKLTQELSNSNNSHNISSGTDDSSSSPSGGGDYTRIYSIDEEAESDEKNRRSIPIYNIEDPNWCPASDLRDFDLEESGSAHNLDDDQETSSSSSMSYNERRRRQILKKTKKVTTTKTTTTTTCTTTTTKEKNVLVAALTNKQQQQQSIALKPSQKVESFSPIKQTKTTQQPQQLQINYQQQSGAITANKTNNKISNFNNNINNNQHQKAADVFLPIKNLNTFYY